MNQRQLSNVVQMTVKEIRSLWHDKILLFLIIWVFSGGIYVASTATSMELHNAPIAIVDEDRSPLSQQLRDAFYGPYFKTPELIDLDEIDPALFAGRYTFVLAIPSGFERDVLAGKVPGLQINIDATRMSQSFIGDSYIQNITSREIVKFVSGVLPESSYAIDLVVHNKFNPNLESFWFGSIMELINNVTMLGIILTGAAVIREREHGTLEHLLVMPIQPVEIVMSKVLANGLVVLIVAGLSLQFIIQGVLSVPVQGSAALFLLGAALHLFAATSMGIFMGTVARTMPQLGLLLILIILPLQMLSGGITPRESMPDLVQDIMLIAPTTHFVSLAQSILYRGAGWSVVWQQFAALILIGTVFFTAAIIRFRQSVANAS